MSSRAKRRASRATRSSNIPRPSPQQMASAQMAALEKAQHEPTPEEVAEQQAKFQAGELKRQFNELATQLAQAQDCRDHIDYVREKHTLIQNPDVEADELLDQLQDADERLEKFIVARTALRLTLGMAMLGITRLPQPGDEEEPADLQVEDLRESDGTLDEGDEDETESGTADSVGVEQGAVEAAEGVGDGVRGAEELLAEQAAEVIHLPAHAADLKTGGRPSE